MLFLYVTEVRIVVNLAVMLDDLTFCIRGHAREVTVLDVNGRQHWTFQHGVIRAPNEKVRDQEQAGPSG